MRKLALLILTLPGFAATLDSTTGTAVPPLVWTNLGSNNITSWNAYGLTGSADSLRYIQGIGMCGLGDFKEISSEMNRGWICFNFQENRWSVMSSGSSWHDEHGDSGHPISALQPDPSTGIIYGACCYAQGNNPEYTREGMYWFDPWALTGRQKNTATALDSNMVYPYGVFDPFTRKLYYLGGGGSSNATLVYYDPTTNVWNMTPTFTQVGAVPIAPGFSGGALAVNTHDKKIYVFGVNGSGGQGGNGVYTIDTLASPITITQVTGITGGPPAARIFSAWAYDDKDGVFILFGGQNAIDNSILNDTWKYDPVAKTWTQLSITGPPVSGSPLDDRLVYDRENNVFMLVDLSMNVWALRLSDGPNAGRKAYTYTPSAGSFNRNSGWAQGPAVSSDGTNTFVAWTESGSGSNSTNAGHQRPYAIKVDNVGSTTNLGSGYLSMESTDTSESFMDVSTGVVNGSVWACWHGLNSSLVPDRLKCKSSNGTNSPWNPTGDAQVTADSNPFHREGPSQIIAVGTTPTVAFKMQDTQNFLPYPVYLDIYQYNGSVWNQLGSHLNINTGAGGVVDSFSIASNGSNPYAAWTELTQTPASGTNGNTVTQSAPQLYLKLWNGSSWASQCGGSGNINGSNRAYSASMTVLGGIPYIAYIERPDGSSSNDGGTASLYVRKCSGGTWSTVGSGTINIDSVSGWAFAPTITNDGTNLYVTWSEESVPFSANGQVVQLGQFAAVPQVHVKKWNGSAWSSVGGALNMDPYAGAATKPQITMNGTTPIVAWGEVKYSTFRQVYAKQWTGTDWAAIGTPAAGGTPPSITTTTLPSAPRNLAYSTTLAATGDTPITWSVIAGTLPAGLSLSGAGVISGTPTTLGSSSITIQASNASGTDSRAFTLTVRNPNVPTDYATIQAGVTGIAGLGCGNTLTVNAGTYTENVVLPSSNCTFSNPLTVTYNGTLIPAGIRITPNYLDPSPKVPRIVGAASGAVIQSARALNNPSSGWVFQDLFIDCSNVGGYGSGCLEFDIQATNGVNASSTQTNDLPSNIEFDHCIIRGSRLGRNRVGINADGQNYIIVDSWIGDMWDYGASDGQAIRANSGDGPITITNTYMDAQTETLGIGGAGSVITTPSQAYGPVSAFLTGGSIPSNVVVDESHLTHGLYLRYDGISGFTWASNQLVRMGQVWVAYTGNNPSGGTRIGVYQARTMATTGGTFPTNFCTTAIGCTFTDGGVTWVAISNFAGGETYIGSGIAKNLAECKQCGVWTIKRSFLQHAWEGGSGGGAQGFALTFSHRTNVAPYSVMGPITFKDNIIDDVAGVLQSSAFGDDADGNIYPTVRSTIASPYTITTGANDTLVVDGTTVTLTPGSRTAAQIANDINLALPHLTVSSVSGPTDNAPYWTKYMLTLSGNVSYDMSYDVGPILGSVRGGITRTDLGGANIDNQTVVIDCTYQSLYNGGAGRAVCAAGANQAELIFTPSGARISIAPGATIGVPTVASSYHDASDGHDYLVITKGQQTKTLAISGNAAPSLGLPSGTTLYCTHPMTRQWYACGVSKGVTFSNNLITNASTDTNKFSIFRAPFLIYAANVHPLEITHNTFDFKYGPAFLGQGVPNSGVIRDNVVLNRNATSSGDYTDYFADGNQYGLSWIHSYLCNPPLTGTTILTYQWMANGTTLPTCNSGVAANNLMPGTTKDTNEVLAPGSIIKCCTNSPKSSFNTATNNVVFAPNSYRLAPPGTVTTLSGSFNILGTNGTSTSNSANLELGTQFFSDLGGQITKLRVYRPASGCPLESVTATLWSPGGANLGAVTFTPALGQWTDAALTSPVNITAGQTYTVSYHPATCYATNLPGSLSSQYDATPLHIPANGAVFGSPGAKPTTTSAQGFGADVVFVETQPFTVGANGTIGSAGTKSFNDPADVGVDTSKLPLIRHLNVNFSDRAAIFAWIDSKVSSAIPGVLRICLNDPDYDPTCTPQGSITNTDPVTGVLADNSDNNSSPKTALERYIIVTGLTANTKYYWQLYRGGHYQTGSFTTMATISGTTTITINRHAGGANNMLVEYGTTYARNSDTITGSNGTATCGTNCSVSITVTKGVPVYQRWKLRDVSNTVLSQGPVVPMLPQ